MTPDGTAEPGPSPEDPTGPGRPSQVRVGSVMEVGIEVALRRWRTLLALALLFAGPAALLTASTVVRLDGVTRDVLNDVGPEVMQGVPVLTVAQFDRLSGAFTAFLLATLLAGILGSLGAVAMSAAVLGSRGTWATETASALRVTLRRAPSVIAFMLVTSAIVVALALAAAAGIFLVTASSPDSVVEGGPGAFAALLIGVSLVAALAYLTMRWCVAYPVMAVEGTGWRASLSRAWSLSADNVLRSAAVVVFATLLTLIGSAALGLLLSVGAAILLGVPGDSLPMVAETLVTAAATVLLAPLGPVLVAVLYVDLRTRRGSLPSASRAGDGVEG